MGHFLIDVKVFSSDEILNHPQLKIGHTWFVLTLFLRENLLFLTISVRKKNLKKKKKIVDQYFLQFLHTFPFHVVKNDKHKVKIPILINKVYFSTCLFWFGCCIKKNWAHCSICIVSMGIKNKLLICLFLMLFY